MTWTVKRNADGEFEYHDGVRLRAFIQKRFARLWLVHRIDSTGRNTGCDSFFTKGEAHRFITENPIFGNPRK